MAGSDTINYGHYMEKAMRGVMADILGHVASHGLPGAHYFYITFETTHPGVDIADWLRERYPEEMMIVMQEWFADLAVMDDRFSLTLNFSNQQETLVIPFDAVKTFIDPSAKFGLKFDDHESDEMVLDLGEIEYPDGEEDNNTPAMADDDDLDGASYAKKPSSADVVSLDRFRKT